MVWKEIQTYFQENASVFWSNLLSHIELSLAAVGVALLICVPLGIWISRKLAVADYIINGINMFRVVPSLAILALAMPVLGVGFLPALLALTVLACPPIIINTYVAFREIDAGIKEAAKGMGMTPLQTVLKVEFPLALPVMLAGVRSASVEVIASATLAVLIGGSGLGSYIINGVSMMSKSYLLIGAVPVALLAIASESVFAYIQKRLSYY
ncbi:Carnitine transport permease protein OpuCB [Paenibacillus allorhizoplanae]|uniref:Carnitine transport permease protein OpuCB n=1 Tax=Paenibacillus allorhizoplanae TaxID=2905648 RepID=A0ABN8H8K0_9BACL|nr:ABC transporter permease [Paenibacillus allorhizoplanae]CAH1231073.1 Carnitine transport permease protein OpuCB [Paenibacillus allorhizoplanae]